MRRRDFIAVMGGATATWPLTATWPFVASAEPGAPVIGLVSIGASPDDPANFRPFLQQMAELGYTDGRNVRYEDPDVIGAGLAQSLSRPGGNLTGLTTLDTDLYGKRLQIFKQAMPHLTRAGVLVSGRQPAYARGSSWEQSFQEAARSLKIELEIAEADESNLEPVLDTLAARGVQGLVVTSDGVYVAQARALAEGALKYRLPTMFVYRRQVQAGGLMAYAARTPDLSRRAAFFVDRIIKGAKPADLPIEQPIHFELIINLKTARVLGLEPSATLLALADEVIE